MWGCVLVYLKPRVLRGAVVFFLSVESVDLFLKRRFEGVDLDTFRKDGVEPFYFATSGFGSLLPLLFC